MSLARGNLLFARLKHRNLQLSLQGKTSNLQKWFCFCCADLPLTQGVYQFWLPMKSYISSHQRWQPSSSTCATQSSCCFPICLCSSTLPRQAGCTFRGGAQVEAFLIANGYRGGIMPFASYHQTYYHTKLGFSLFATLSFPMTTFVPEQNFSVWLLLRWVLPVQLLVAVFWNKESMK